MIFGTYWNVNGMGMSGGWSREVFYWFTRSAFFKKLLSKT
jgi:hypothetical protein